MIPHGWASEKLGNRVRIRSGVAPADLHLSSEGAFPYLKVEDLNLSEKYQQGSRTYTNDRHRSLVPAGTVIFPKRGAAIMNNKVRINSVACYLDSNLMSLEPTGDLQTEYLFYLLQNEQLFKIADTSSIPQINNKHIEPYRFLLPPQRERDRIVLFLQAWDTAIQKTEQLIAAKERHYSHELSHLFSGHGMTTRTYRLSDISYIPQKLPAAPKDDDVYVLVRLYCKGVERNGRQKKAPTKNGRPILRRSAGELLVGRQNIHNGGFGVVPQSLDGALASNAITSLSFYPDKACTEYVFCFLSRPSYYKKLEKVMGGTGQKEISESQLLAISIPLPDIRTQTAIARYLNALREEIDLLGQSVAALKTQKRGLMQKLLTGQWRLPIPETHEVLSDG